MIPRGVHLERVDCIYILKVYLQNEEVGEVFLRVQNYYKNKKSGVI